MTDIDVKSRARRRAAWGIACASGVGAVVSAGVWLARMPTLEIAKVVDGPQKRPGAVRLLITGDTGFGNDAQRSVAAAMERACVRDDVDAVLLLGDNFYHTGVASVDDPQWKEKFEDIYASPCLSKLKFFTIFGNHDYRQNPNAQIEYTLKSGGRWNLPARSYVLRFEDVVDFYAIDTNIPDLCGAPGLCSMDWMARQMNASTARWKIVMGHHPLLSGGKYPEPKWYAALTVPKLACEGKADFYLAGHDHNLQHLRGPAGFAGCTVNQIVLGSGGAPLAPVKEIPGKTQFARAELGFASVTIDASRVKFAFHGVNDGAPLYEFSKTRDAASVRAGTGAD